MSISIVFIAIVDLSLEDICTYTRGACALIILMNLFFFECCNRLTVVGEPLAHTCSACHTSYMSPNVCQAEEEEDNF